jgi:hypothetical protein
MAVWNRRGAYKAPFLAFARFFLLLLKGERDPATEGLRYGEISFFSCVPSLP